VKIKTIIASFALSVCSAFCDTPSVKLYVDVTTPYPQKFDFSVRAGNTPVITVACITGNTATASSTAYTNFGTGWVPEFNYFLDDKASAGVSVTGTLETTTGIITFTTLTNSFPASGKYFAEVYLQNGTSPKLTIAQGQLTVLRSPSSGSFASLNLSNRLNWDIVENIGTVPWAAGAEPVFFASVAYNITAAMTSNWTTAYGYGTRVTALETGRVTLAAYNAYTNTQASTNANLQAQILAISNVVPAGAVSEVTYNTHVAAQASTNAGFSALHSAQAGTNAAFSALFALQSASNTLFSVRIASNDTFRAAQASTNAGYQALFDAQANTNAGFEVRIASNETGIAELVDTNAVFQTLFDAQASTNATLQSQITNNLAGQLVTNASHLTRIQSNEYFVSTTQPNTNAALQLQITNNLAAQAATNAGFDVRITSNETFNTAQANTNATLTAFMVAQITTNDQYASGIASNDLFRTFTQPATNAALQTQITNNLAASVASNALYESRITSNELFRTISQPATNTSLQTQITNNLAIQTASNVIFNARIGSLESGSTIANRFDEMIVANSSLIDTNISGLTDGVYTGSLTSVAYTGAVDITQGRVYVWGFEKSSAFGTSVMTLAGATITAISAGLASNHFVALTSDTNQILTLTGTGDAKSDVSNVFVRVITNGMLYAAEGIQAPSATFDNLALRVGSLVTGKVWACTNAITGEGAWADAGAGDMLKAVYDLDDNGQVDVADDSDALGGVAAAGYATTGALAIVSNTVAGLTGGTMTTYDAGDGVLVRANRTNVTATLASTTYTIDGDAGTVLEMAEVRHDVSLGSSYTLVVTTNVLAKVGTRRVGNVFQAYNEFNGNLIPGAQSRPDAATDTQFNVSGLSAGGMTHALCKHLF